MADIRHQGFVGVTCDAAADFCKGFGQFREAGTRFGRYGNHLGDDAFLAQGGFNSCHLSGLASTTSPRTSLDTTSLGASPDITSPRTSLHRLNAIHIALVDQQQKLTPGPTSIDLAPDILGVGQNRILAARQIGHSQYDRCLVELLECTLDADFFDQFVRLSYAGGINESEQHAA